MITRQAPKRQGLISRLIMIVITITIFSLLLRNIEIDTLVSDLSNTRLIYIFYALLLTLGFIMLFALKWKLFIMAVGCKIIYARCLKIIISTIALNAILPAKGGDFIKCWPTRDILPVSQGIGIVILERLIDISLLCLMVLIGSMYLKNTNITLIAFLILVVCLIIIVILKQLKSFFKNKDLLKIINNINLAAEALVRNPIYATYILTIGIIIWGGSAAQVYILYKAVGLDVPIIHTIVLVPVIIFIGLLPITVAGMGTRDAAFIYFFSEFASGHSSLAVGIYFTLLRYWLPALLAIPFLKYLQVNSCFGKD